MTGYRCWCNFMGWFLNGKLRPGGLSPRRARACVCLRIIIILPPLSWKGSRGIKRSRGSKEDDGFEVVPIEDPGKMYTVEKTKASFSNENQALTFLSLFSETSNSGP